MGALVAAFIAIGKTPEEMVEFAKNVSYYRLADMDLRLGLLRGDRIMKLLSTVFGDQRIEETAIPLRIVATDLDAGTPRIFSSGKITDALRASFAIPGIFSPKVIDGTHYVDGGIVMNLPIPALSGQDVIAVSALKADFGEMIRTREILGFQVKSGFFRNNFEIIYRSVTLLLKANEDAALMTTGKNVLLVRPEFGGLHALDFNKVDGFVELGYDAAAKLRF
jgi:NTE family protein